MGVLEIAAIVLLVATHLFVHELKFTHLPRSRWLSIAGGISITYVFLDILPEIQHHQQAVLATESVPFWIAFEKSIFLFSLLGLVLFYALDKLAVQSHESKRQEEDPEEYVRGVFWIHLFFFAVYNFIIGHLLFDAGEKSMRTALLFSITMMFHLTVTDHALSDHYPDVYRRRGRWLLTAALIAGWFTALLFPIGELTLGCIFAFIAGGIIMNVLKEELPEERQSHLPSFLLGVGAYAVLLLLM